MPSFRRDTAEEAPSRLVLDGDTRALLENRLHDPRRVLGVHTAANGRVVVRAWLPQASEARLGTARLTMKPSAPGLFEWQGAANAVEPHYEIRWRDEHGTECTRVDPYAFDVELDPAELAAFGAAAHTRADRLLGAHCLRRAGIAGVRFAVWAPNAERVSVIGDFNAWDARCHPMIARENTGVWELFVPGLDTGELYKYEIRNRYDGSLHVKADPYGAAFENRPATASRVARSRHAWGDGEWLERRRARDWLRAPMSIYELHLGSWRRGDDGRFSSYEEIGALLAPYVRDLGFTHVELLPISEHPFDDSWGYQCTGYFAPTRRHGEPDDLRALIDVLHEHDIGVLLDWVPGHFPKDDHALARFDGVPLYEHGDPLRGEQPDWGTLVFDYSRHEIQSFLLSSARFWLEEFHFDGLRVDAVASMLYLDYSRGPGQWGPNAQGGNENLEAVAFFKRLNELTHGECPGTVTVAEESTSWPQVSRPTYTGGLGFSFKWNMGWMHDTLEYMSKDPAYRRYHHDLLSFGPIYAFSENFVLPLSHDEVVHGKRSLWDKMPGDEWQKTANLRLLLAYQWTYPGKKLLFMGAELAQRHEWNHRDSLPWHLADTPESRGMAALIRDLNSIYRTLPALHERDHDASGFAWLAWDDADNSVLSYVRRSEREHVVVVLNFTPVPRHGYRVGTPAPGRYRELLNSDSDYYGGSNLGNGEVETEAVAHMGHEQSIVLTLPPLGALVLGPV